MSGKKQLSRRAVLRGLGTGVALPWLESLAAGRVLAAGKTADQPPKRMAFIYVPNGIHMPEWTPKQTGPLEVLPPTLASLEPFKKELLVLSGLTLDKARPNGDGPGDHARAMSAFLTASQPRKTHGADISVGISVDQLAAQKIGSATRFPSLELGIERGLNSGNCDSGYSCAYSANISWRSATTPQAKEINPRLVFERLFANGASGEADSARARRERYKLSVLDFVLEEANQLKHRLGAQDQKKLDEYLNSVRELELRIARSGPAAGTGAVKVARPAGIPTDYQDHIRIMCDLLALAFQGDVTRIATFVLANDGSNRSYRTIEVPEGHHDLSHHGNDKAKQAKLAAINRFHIGQLGHLLARLKAVREGQGTLLDNCMIVYGCGIGDGNRHNHDQLPIIMAGKGGGTISTGRHVAYPRETPLANLYVSMLERVGVMVSSFGDSRGRLDNLR